MDIKYHRMHAGQAEQVADLVHGLIAEYGRPFSSQLSAETLLQNSGFLNIEVAELNGEIIGICTWVMSFSTWRGVRGMYIADHFALPNVRQKEVAHNLLVLAAISAASEGAHFIRTEVDITHQSNEELYSELGFWTQTRHVVHFLEPAQFEALIDAALPD